MNNDGASFVVSDRLGYAVEKANLYDQIGPDVGLGTWDYFIHHSVDFDVLVLDMDLSQYVEEVGHGIKTPRITEHKDEFLTFFRAFRSDVSYFLNSGDTIIVLLDSAVPVVKSPMGSMHSFSVKGINHHQARR